MTLQPISSSSNTIAETDSELEHLSNMSSSTISNCSSVLASPEDARDDSTQPSLLNGDNLNGSTDDSTKVEVLPQLRLASFFPIIENLPGLVLESNAYHVDVPILPDSLDGFMAHSRRVEDLILMDVPDDPASKVTSSTIDRLIRVDNPESPFLSSLKSLHLADADTSLRYLVFCSSPSLELLEVVGIPPHHQITISDFMSDLSHYAPQMKQITLGPGLLSSGALKASLKFPHLKHLSIINAAVSLDFAFLQEISTLPELESLVLETSSTKYKPRAPSESAGTDSSLFSTEHVRRRLDLQAEGDHLEDTGEASPCIRTILTPIPFQSLSKLTIVSQVLLMGDLVYYLFPRDVKEVSLTLVRARFLSVPPDWDWGRESYMQGGTATEPATSFPNHDRASDGSLSDRNAGMTIPVTVCSEPQRTKRGKKGSKLASAAAVYSSYSACQVCPGCTEHRAQLERDQIAAQAKREALEIERAEKQRQREIENLAAQTCCFASVVQVFLEFAKPTTIYMANLDPTASSASNFSGKSFEFPEFPSSIFHEMLSCPTLSQLEVKDWVLTSMDLAFLDSTSTPSTTTLPMRWLYLPVEGKSDTGITLPILRAIAHRYPNLRELQCHILPSPESFAFTINEPMIKHGLEMLYVGEGSPVSESEESSEERMAIATYIWFLFPSLKRITKCDGCDEGDWDHIHKLVKMCQMVRAAE